MKIVTLTQGVTENHKQAVKLQNSKPIQTDYRKFSPESMTCKTKKIQSRCIFQEQT